MEDQDKVLILREWAVAVTDAIQALAAIRDPKQDYAPRNVAHHAENVERAYELLRDALNDEVGSTPTIPE